MRWEKICIFGIPTKIQVESSMEQQDVRQWLQNQIAEELGVAAESISYDEDFENFNLDSLSLVSISYELELLVKTEISPTVFTEFNTINKLAAWINAPK